MRGKHAEGIELQRRVYETSTDSRAGQEASRTKSVLAESLSGHRIAKFFDTLDKAVLREFLKQRVGDGVIRRLIGKWLSAGVLDQGVMHYPERGVPQGAVISPKAWAEDSSAEDKGGGVLPAETQRRTSGEFSLSRLHA